jgi:3-oxoacyl-[acyl-carrier-protein] synthase-3
MKIHQNNVVIKGIATAIPKNKVDLLSYASLFGEDEIKRIALSTGITSVRVANKQSTSELCLAAAETLLNELNLNGSDFDGIIFVSQTPDKKMPATSIVMQHKLSMPKEAVAFDVNYGCSGYIYGLYLSSMLLNSGGCQRVLLCVGDVITSHLGEKDKNVRLVFGDAGSATVLEKGEADISFLLMNDGSGADYLNLAYGDSENLYMHGAKIMEFALKEVPPLIDEILNFRKWEKDDVGSFILHQPNLFMLNYLMKKAKIQSDRLPIAVEGFGNTGPASIPLVLTHHRESLVNHHQLEKTILCGFGVGLSWAAAALNLSQTKLFPLVEV